MISPVLQKDLDQLRSFAEFTFRYAYEHMNDPVQFEAYCTEFFSEEQWLKEWQHPDSEFWWIWIKGQLAGYLKLNFDNHQPTLQNLNTIQIERIYVAPDFQSKGVGLQLMEFSEKRGKEKGCAWIWLSVWQKNPRAVRFYERCGYVICGTEIFPVGDDPQLDWVMKKAL
ncbi:MAG: GNAT family N-acetyltransferase [Saprospiraceae bacterium]|nr:GNAT family N-acetyltransferase [Saprospiraceae bacterium]